MARICSAAAFLPAGKNASLILFKPLSLKHQHPRIPNSCLEALGCQSARLLGCSYLHIQSRARSFSPCPFSHFLGCQSCPTPIAIKKSEMPCKRTSHQEGIASEARHHRMIHLVCVLENQKCSQSWPSFLQHPSSFIPPACWRK